MTKDELIEQLAAIEHERWADWQGYVHEHLFSASTHADAASGSWCLLNAVVERWERQIATPYAELSGDEKQSDRDQVMRYWPVIVKFVEEWLFDLRLTAFSDDEAGIAARLWRKEMGQ